VNSPVVLLLGAAVVGLVALLAVVLLRRPRGETRLLQQQLLALRERVDVLATDVPRTLADGSREQQRTLADLRERLGQLGAAAQELRRVGESVTEVQDLLRVPKLRGTVGELWLEELLRQVLPSAHYAMQYGFRSGERVDAVLRLGDRLVPVDAKFPLEACRRMFAAQGDEAARERRAFARSLKARIDEIAGRYIRPDEGTYDFALMYIPAESVYYEAVVRGGDAGGVLAHALDRRVIPVSPHTFYAYLLVILHGLRGLRVEQRAQQLVGELGTLRQQFEGFWGAFDKLGTHLHNAVKQHADSERQGGRVRERVARLSDGGAEPGTVDFPQAGEPGPR
jgi:DNA recombination protein RmuC